MKTTNKMKGVYKAIFTISMLTTILFSHAQSSLHFENKKMYLGELEINNAYGISFNYENISKNSVKISYEPITNFVNATYKKDNILPGEKGAVKVNFYPENEGPFNEKLYVIVNENEKIELSIYGSVKSISQSFKSLSENNKLFGDRDIGFMVVDAQTFIGIPYAKIFIKNSINNKSYIGIANRFGVLVNRIPEGKYLIQALVKDYGKEVLDIKLDPNKNIAYILLDKPEEKDSTALIAQKKELDTLPLETADSIKLSKESSNQKIAMEANSKAPYYDPNPASKTEKPNSSTDVKSDIVTPQERKTLNLILLVDVSKSMENSQRMTALKKSIIYLIENYKPQDFLAILTFNDQVNELMARGQIDNKDKCKNYVNSIVPSGTTDGLLGLDKAFEILQKNYLPDAINMVIIATDGKMNKYAYEDKAMLEKIEKMNENGIQTSVLSFGNSQINKTKLNLMTEVGGGVYIDMTEDRPNLESIIFDDIYSTLLQVK